MKNKTIAIPQAMYYFEYGIIWETFFNELGLDVILSGETDGNILSYGTRCASSDLCLPVKALFGHIYQLLNFREKADYLFLPNIYMTFEKCYTCPKTIGITDMVKATFQYLPTVIEPDFYGDMKAFFIETGRALGFSRAQSMRAYKTATVNTPKNPKMKREGITVALIGHSYILGDDYLNMQINQKLNKMNVHCITPRTIPIQTLSAHAKNTEYKNPFWHSASRNMGFTKYVADSKLADGIIFLNSFGCGTDSLYLGFCSDYIRRHSNIPAITVSLDEHSGEAGFVTRLEAFVDCIESSLAG